MRRKKTSQKKRRQNLFVLVGLTVLVGAAVVSGIIFMIQKKTEKTQVVQEKVQTRETEKNAIHIWEETFPELNVGLVKLKGLTQEEAEAALKQAYEWELVVMNEGATEIIPDLISSQIARIWKGIMTEGIEKESYDLNYEEIETLLKAEASCLAEKWDQKPVNSQAVSFDKETGVYEYSKEEFGRTLNQEKLVSDLMEAIRAGNFKGQIQADFSQVTPERTQAQAKAAYQVIGTFTTKTTDNKNRNENIRLAVNAIDGLVLKPSEEFSFNNTTGNRTSEKGYRPAGAYKNGVLIEEPGGGVCQVSTTLYHAIIKSGYKTTERNAHSYAPSYVEKGQDAMVSFDGYAGPDLKFKNTADTTVVLRAVFEGRDLKISIVGIPVLEDGVSVEIRSEKVRDVEPEDPVYEENPSLPYGSEKVIDQPRAGSVWKSFRVVKKDGQVVEETTLHNSSYKAKKGLIQRNTTVQNTQETLDVTESTETNPEETTGGTDEGTKVEPTIETVEIQTESAEQSEINEQTDELRPAVVPELETKTQKGPGV